MMIFGLDLKFFRGAESITIRLTEAVLSVIGRW